MGNQLDGHITASDAESSTNISIPLDLKLCDRGLLSNDLGRKSHILMTTSPPVIGQGFDLFSITFILALGKFELRRKPLDFRIDALDLLVIPRDLNVILHHYNILVESLHNLRKEKLTN
ncbi:hypothetical protein DY000_02035139 [Brassica cretica]|nr:hypothetical protein DY000_02035139 [Brassica cretica]